MDTQNLKVLMYRVQNDELEVFVTSKNSGVCHECKESISDEKDFEERTGVPTDANEDVIALDSVAKEGLPLTVLAVEAELNYCVSRFFEIKEEEGTYMAVKEAFKKVLPHEYKLLKELKETIRERNLIKFI